MWWLAALLYGSSRPKATDAARTLVVTVFLLVWAVAAILDLIGVHP
jgi:hypothetical protein